MRAAAITLASIVVFWAVHEMLAIALDDAELIERLLSPGPEALVAIPAALVLYALRLGLMFLAPGVALIAALAIARDVTARLKRRWTSRSERIGRDAGTGARADHADRSLRDHAGE